MNIIDTNSKIGRQAYYDTSHSMIKGEYTDAISASVPRFIEKLAKAPYDKVLKGNLLEEVIALDDPARSISIGLDEEVFILAEKEDLQTQMLGNDKMVKSYNYCVDAVSSYYGTSGPFLDHTGLSQAVMTTMFSGLATANIKELSKRQVLVGSPTWHHGCSDGDHFNHKGPLDDGIERELVYIAESLAHFILKKDGHIKRAQNYTLPLTSSQGLMLKSRRDSPQFRAVSKALQGRYAQMCDSEDELYECVNAFNDLAESKGYSRFFDSFFLGKRKQHASKDEPIDDGESNMEVTNGLQGRVRGIFPPPELFKVYYKPFCDGLKKYLFTNTALCSVDVADINKKHCCAIANYVINVANNGGKGEGLSHGFYDLSAYDRNTNSSLGLAYQKFLSIAFENWDKKEGKNFSDFNLIFPEHCGSDSNILIQNIKGRSTQSGQPDVTVKNNICHIIMLADSIDKIIASSADFGDKWISKNHDERLHIIWDLLINGKNGTPLIGVVVKIHGDDAFLSWVGMKSSDMTILHDNFSRFGIPCADEESLIYLKKTFDVLRLSKVVEKILTGGKTIFDIKSRDSLVRSMLTDTFMINNVTGSIIRNRFGEYPILEPIVGLLSHIDTFSKLPDDAFDNCIDYWADAIEYYRLINGSINEKLYNNNLLKKQIKNGASDDKADDKIGKERAARETVNSVVTSFSEKIRNFERSAGKDYNALKLAAIDARNELSTSLNIVLADKSAIANELRGFLSRLYYSNFEQFDDDELANLYGDLFYNEEDISQDVALAGKSRQEVMAMMLDLQEQLFDKEGDFILDERFSDIGKRLLDKM